LKQDLSLKETEIEKLHSQVNSQDIDNVKQERVTSQYEQMIETLEQENEALKIQKDEYG
jgi:hypothetical protein